MKGWIDFWQERSHSVLNYPRPIEDKKFLVEWPRIHKEFYKTLEQTDIHFIANENKDNIKGYIGAGTFSEISFTVGLNLAFNRNIKVVLYQKPSSDISYFKDIQLWLSLGWLEIFDSKKYHEK